MGLADAALLNGVAGHALDYDDTIAGPFHGHATAPILPGALALAEARDASVPALLGALVAGVASATALGRRMNPAHYDAGWHATATLGTFGAGRGLRARPRARASPGGGTRSASPGSRRRASRRRSGRWASRCRSARRPRTG